MLLHSITRCCFIIHIISGVASKEFDDRTVGQRVADSVSAFVGSWSFVGIQVPRILFCVNNCNVGIVSLFVLLFSYYDYGPDYCACPLVALECDAAQSMGSLSIRDAQFDAFGPSCVHRSH